MTGMQAVWARAQHHIKGLATQGLWSTLRPEWALPSGLTVQVRSSAEWVIYNDIFVDREYDEAILDVVKNSGPNPVIMDLGANVGYFGLRFADLWIQQRGSHEPFQLIGVEGAPAVFAELLKRITSAGKNSSLLRDQLQYHFGLAGERSGEMFISTSLFHVTNSIMGKRATFGSMVPFLDIETLIPPTRRISLLKCDIEGAEQLFLQTYPALLERVDQVIIELHTRRCDVDRCIELLKKSGLSRHQRMRECPPEITVDRFLR